MIEDLATVLTAISSRTGANGPQSPMTQYILREAVDHLIGRLIDDGRGREGEQPLPRLLSLALGHQPFIEGTLALSQHQMLRRWPLATDWYSDVVSYLLRPNWQRPNQAVVERDLAEALTRPFGEHVRYLAGDYLPVQGGQRLFRVAEAITALWPEYPPVKRANRRHRDVLALWEPILQQIQAVYGLRLAPGVTIGQFNWALQAVHWQSVQQRLSEPDQPPDQSLGSHSAQSALLIIAGSVVDADAKARTAAELAGLLPVRRLSLN